MEFNCSWYNYDNWEFLGAKINGSIGTAGGPVGTVVGAIIGGIAGKIIYSLYKTHTWGALSGAAIGAYSPV